MSDFPDGRKAGFFPRSKDHASSGCGAISWNVSSVRNLAGRAGEIRTRSHFLAFGAGALFAHGQFPEANDGLMPSRSLVW